MILGYGTNLSRDGVVRRARVFLAALGPGRDHTVDPDAQRMFGQIVKVRCRENSLQTVVFAARKRIESGNAGAEAPKWATEEISPEAGELKARV